MSDRLRSGLWTTVLLAIFALLETIGLQSGTVGLILVALLAGVALITLLFRVDFERLGIAAALAAAATLTWNGIYLGPERPGDLLVLISLMLFVLARPNDALGNPAMAAGVKQLGVVIVLVMVIQVLFPPDSGYLARRVVLNATGQLQGAGSAINAKSIIGTDVGVAFKFLVGIAIIPMVFSAAVLVERRAVRWLAVAFTWCTGHCCPGGPPPLIMWPVRTSAISITRIPNKVWPAVRLLRSPELPRRRTEYSPIPFGDLPRGRRRRGEPAREAPRLGMRCRDCSAAYMPAALAAARCAACWPSC